MRELQESSDFLSFNHFSELGKMVSLGSGAQRRVKDYALTRYACYLIAQNGDSKKEQIALAQTYFAVQTRKQEILEESLEELERLQAREKLTETEKEFAKTLFEHEVDSKGIAEIKSFGDKALFGGHTTNDMKKKLGVGIKKPLADFLPTVTIKAKDLAAEITTFKTKQQTLMGKPIIKKTHILHNQKIRNVLTEEGIYPEQLPPAEDIKKLQRRLKA